MLDSLKLLRSLATDRRGVTAVEYAVVAAVLVAAVSTAFTGLAGKLSTVIAAVLP